MAALSCAADAVHDCRTGVPMMRAGFSTEASEWGDWLLRAAAGHPGQLQMLYGAAGERFLPEHELKHLRGYEDSPAGASRQ